jgi:hypothetical protein
MLEEGVLRQLADSANSRHILREALASTLKCEKCGKYTATQRKCGLIMCDLCIDVDCLEIRDCHECKYWNE